jgi:hypothetical protein
MGTLPTNIVELIKADKVASFTKWDESDKLFFSMLAPLTTGHVTVGGLSLRVKISKEFVARDAMAAIEFGTTRRNNEPLWRIDWRPQHRHNNKGNGVYPFEWAEFDRISHDHNFFDNFLPDMSRVRKSLPRARPVDPDPSTLTDFLDFSGKCFNISNMSSLKLPTATVDLFWTKDG